MPQYTLAEILAPSPKKAHHTKGAKKAHHTLSAKHKGVKALRSKAGGARTPERAKRRRLV